eukprot:scpid37297/ scgid0980/ 
MERLVANDELQPDEEVAKSSLGLAADLTLSKRSSKARRRFSKDARKTCVRVTLIAVFTPLLFSSIGAIVDRVIFGPGVNNVNYHARYAAYSALVVAPLAIFRLLVVTLSRPAERKRNVNVADFVAYLLLTIAVGVALPRTILAGPEIFHAADHAKDIFTVNGMYEKIKTESDVYDWLETMFTNIYNDSFPSNKGSRFADARGRIILLGMVRLRQVRVKPVACDKRFADLGTVGSEMCYPPYSKENEDKSTYSPMNFSYSDAWYNSFEGRRHYPSKMIASTATGDYSLAGFWTIFPQDVTRQDCTNHMRDMHNASWIDAQTRLVGIDTTVLFPDFHPFPVWGALQMNILVSSSGKFLPQPFYLVPNYMPQAEKSLTPDAGPPSTNPNLLNLTASATQPPVGIAVASRLAYMNSSQLMRQAKVQGSPDVALSDSCVVVVGSLYLTPFYLGIFCAFVYTMQIHIHCAVESRRQYLSSFFTYTELVWMLTVLLSWVFRSVWLPTCRAVRSTYSSSRHSRLPLMHWAALALESLSAWRRKASHTTGRRPGTCSGLHCSFTSSTFSSSSSSSSHSAL